MTMNDLIRYDIPAEIICLWKAKESTRLLPLQESAVKRGNLFGGENLLIQAPTSSGKTFIGEMAAVQTALRRKKVVYMVPLKALAEEKFRDFKAKYEDYGIKVIIATRDHREYDRDLEDGDFSVAIVVYEKLAQLLVRRPERLKEIELIIADELEILSDPERGGTVELLLTKIVQSSCRMIGLSAVIGEAERLAQWMGAKPVMYENRPVELHFGVLHEGTFRYRAYNSAEEGTETLVDAPGESSWEVLTQNLCRFVEQGETCLVFVKAKHEARRGAELLAQRVEGAPAREAMEGLQGLEPTACRESLLRTLAVGVAFHNADLSPQERHLVEEAFRAGAVKVMVSTSTLAVGLNMPARNVFITADKWRYDSRFGMPWKAPISRSEYENMSGRAGRYGAGHDFGRSILIANTTFDEETLWRRYIEGEREAIEPRLAEDPLEDYVLRLVAAGFCKTVTEVIEFLESTLTGQWIWRERYTLEEVEFRIRAAINRAADYGMLTLAPEGKLEATPFGHAVAAKGIAIDTARELEQWVTESHSRDWSPLDLLLTAALTQDGRMYAVTLTAQEYDHANYPKRLRQEADGEDLTADVALNRLRASGITPFFEEVRAIKIALFLNDWIEEASLCDLEERYHTLTGQVLAAADQISWVIDAAAAIAVAQGAPGAVIRRLKRLADRVQRGLRDGTLPLANWDVPGLSRAALVALVHHNLDTAEAIAAAPLKLLEQWMMKADAKALKALAEGHCNGAPPTPEPDTAPRGESLLPVLIVDDRRPGQILVDGVPVDLQEKQYRLVRALAEFPGECVPYDTIYDVVWGDAIVENNQMHFQKRKLLDRIKAVAPEHERIVRTVPKRGFVLDLEPEQVDLHVHEPLGVVA